MQQPLLQNLRWLRAVGDSVFATGVLALGWFILGLKTGWSIAPGANGVDISHRLVAEESEAQLVN